MAKRNVRTPRVQENDSFFEPDVTKMLGHKFRFKCMNQSQKEYSNLITDKEIIIAAGPAGTGKSYVAIGRAIELFQNVSNPYKRIIISKPAVEAEEKIGFIPGTEREKMEPHVASSLDIVDKIIGKANRLKLEIAELLVIQPLGFIRGKTFDNAIIIIEEAQNLSPNQCKTILSRLGQSSKLIISGDLDQSDRYNDVRQSGLFDLFVKHKNIPEIGFYEFDTTDIVRNPLITKILDNYPKTEIPDIDEEIRKKKQDKFLKVKFDKVNHDKLPKPAIESEYINPDSHTIFKSTEYFDKKISFKGVKKFFKEKFTW